MDEREQDEPNDNVVCRICGEPITDAQHDEQGGLCDDCAGNDSAN